MTPTKEQQAQEYAEKKFSELLDVISTNPWNDVKTFLAQAYSDGYTACEQSMWRSVEEELPEFGQKVIVRAECESMYGEKFVIIENLTFESNKYFGNSFKLRESADKGIKLTITHWMPIPSLPDTNTEKK